MNVIKVFILTLMCLMSIIPPNISTKSLPDECKEKEIFHEGDTIRLSPVYTIG